MKIAIIGSNSFSGSNYVNHCLTNGAQVLGIGRSKQPDSAFLPYLRNTNIKNFSFAQASLTEEFEKLIELLKDFRPTYIVNFAAQSMVAESWITPEDWYQANTVAIAKLSRSIAEFEFLERLVQVTTPEVYGSTSDWISEGAPFNPSTPYAISRAASDLHLRAESKNSNLPVVFTRTANVFGEGQQLYRLIPKVILYAKSGKPFPLHGGGISRRSFIHIEDASSATWSVMLNGAIGEDYHISTDELVSIRDLVAKTYEACLVPLKEPEIIPDRPGKDQGYFLSSTKIRSEFGWAPKVGLIEGLARTEKWVQRNLETFKELPWEYTHKR